MFIGNGQLAGQSVMMVTNGASGQMPRERAGLTNEMMTGVYVTGNLYHGAYYFVIGKGSG
jgi:hypothetical protein